MRSRASSSGRRRELVEPERLSRRCETARAASPLRASSTTPRCDHGVGALADPLLQLVRRDVETHDERRAAHRFGPEPGLGRDRATLRPPPTREHGRRAAGRSRGSTSAAAGSSCRGAHVAAAGSRSYSRSSVGARRGLDGRRDLEIDERRTQVQPGATRDDGRAVGARRARRSPRARAGRTRRRTWSPRGHGRRSAASAPPAGSSGSAARGRPASHLPRRPQCRGGSRGHVPRRICRMPSGRRSQ